MAKFRLYVIEFKAFKSYRYVYNSFWKKKFKKTET